MSSEVGELDEDAFRDVLSEDPAEALSLLADMAAATDEGLRRLARALAGRIFTDVARSGTATKRGTARLVRQRADVADGDIDLDSSLDAISAARVTGQPVALADLAVRTWRRPETALCLLVDRSGSMQGARLATAAISAAAAVFAGTRDCSVVAFADDPIVLKEQLSQRPVGQIVDDLLSLRGSGVTNLTGALRAARDQLAWSAAARKVVVVLSDCRVTAGGDATDAARQLDEILVLAPADDTADAREFAERVGARWMPLGDAVGAPGVLNELLG